MTRTLAGKVALISGGARGIGAATVRKLAKAGCDIIINYYNSADLAEQLVAEVQAAEGVKAFSVQANVACSDSVRDMANVINERVDKIDILVSNAASGVLKPAMKMKLKHWHWCLDTNAFALPLLLQQFKSLMPSGARALALSSLGAVRAIPDYAFIGAAKAALESLVRSLSVELAPLGISVNTISAGVVDTDALAYFPEREMLLRQSQEKSLLGRVMTPEDVANVVYLLCQPEADFIRGQTIFADAGYSIIG